MFSSGEEACWTPDGKSVVSGSRDGGVYVWDIARAIADRAAAGYVNGSGINSLNGLSANSLLSANRELKPFKVLKAHGTPSHIVAFNPKYLMMVSGSTELVSELLFHFIFKYNTCTVIFFLLPAACRGDDDGWQCQSQQHYSKLWNFVLC